MGQGDAGLTDATTARSVARGADGGRADGAPPATLGRYRLLDRRGAGGMGVVYAAHDPMLDRVVAIKLLHDLSGSDVSALREARALARVAHPNVVQVFEVDVVDDRVYVVMEYVAGPTLAEWLVRTARGPAEIIDVYLQAGRGLAAVHAAGLVHRDFKPSNVLLGDDGRVRVVDFGLVSDAHESESDPADVTMSRSSRRAGTPRYMSPEQRRGEAVDARGDQFTFCLCVHEALFGELPQAAVMRRPSALLRRLLRVLRVGLDQDPARRFPSMEALGEALERARARPRWPARIGAVGLALGAVFAVGEEVASDAALCASVAQLGRVWTVERSADLEARLPTVATAVERHIGRWSDVYDQACAREPRGVLFDMQRECLAARLAELDAALRVLSDGGEATAEQALLTIHELPAVERCADEGALRRAAEPMRVVRSWAEDPALRQLLFETRALVRGSAVERYRAGLSRLIAEAEDPSDLRVEALIDLGRSRRALAEAAGAWDALREAHHGSRLLGRGDLAARAAAALAVVAAKLMSDPNAAAVWEEVALTDLEALRDEGLLRADVLVELAEADAATGALARARAHLDAARTIRVRVLGESHIEVAMVLLALGGVLERLGDAREALAALLSARALLVANGESGLPRFGGLQVDMAIVLTQLGREEEALALLAPQLARTRAQLGDEHFNAHRIQQHIARALAGLGRSEEAAALRQEVHAAYTRHFGPRSLWTAEIAVELADSLRVQGRPAEAALLARAAHEFRRDRLGERAEETLRARAVHAHALLDADELTGADIVLGSDREAPSARGGAAARELLFAVLRLRWAQGRGRPEVLLRARQLHDELRGDDAAQRALRNAVAAWLTHVGS